MVEIHELRIGNLLRYDNEISRVSELRHDNMITTSEFEIAGNEFFDPVPLTPEILEACGFKKSNEFEKWYYQEEGLSLDIHLDSIFWWSIDDIGDNEGSHYRPIKDLHQLQNLYFSLTGKELEIKELSIR